MQLAIETINTSDLNQIQFLMISIRFNFDYEEGHLRL